MVLRQCTRICFLVMMVMCWMSLMMMDSTTSVSAYPQDGQVWSSQPAPAPAPPQPIPTPTPVLDGNGPIPVIIGWKEEYRPVIHDVTPPIAIVAIVLICTGIVFCFFGTGSFNYALFLSGYYCFGAATFMVLFAIYAKLGSIGGEWVYACVMIVIAILGGMITLAIVQAAVLCMGALLGYITGLILLMIGVGMLLSTSQPGQIAYAMIAIIIGVVFVVFHEQVVLLISTSITGALSMMVGLDLFVRTGFVEVVANVMTGAIKVNDGQSIYFVYAIIPPTQVPGAAWAILAILIVFAAFGSVVQQIPPKKGPPKPAVPKPAWKFWPFAMVAPPQGAPPTYKSWLKGEAGHGWRLKL